MKKIFMNIKKGDKVKVLTGKDKGKTGKVLQVFPARQRVSVEAVNLLIKHLRPRRKGEGGQRIEFPSPLHASNLQLVCSQCGKPTRVNYKITVSPEGKKKKFRICKKCQGVIE